ncbi:MAG: EthD domain-containing protein, partial [Halioglobus sp.]|nr:EthD domain-containing protein [Halioglobus sp.]
MEKLIYPLWKPDGKDADAFRDELLAEVAGPLARSGGVHGVRLCVADSAVAPAGKRRMQSGESLPDAALSLWVDDAGAAADWEPLIDAHVARRTCYLVAEAEPLVNQLAHPSKPGERVYGMCHVVFMTPPPEMSREDWLSVWKDSHTQVAIDTQSTFGYRQNVVVRRLGQDTPACYAIVEENFPPEAMEDDHAFYATGGDEGVLQRHMAAMMESCARFIDFSKIDVIPM